MCSKIPARYLLLCASVLASCGRIPTEEVMATMANAKITLKSRLLTEGGAPLLPEQVAEFAVTMRNASRSPVQVDGVELNDYTPRFRVTDAEGQLLGEYSPRDRDKRLLAAREFGRSPANVVTLEPGGENAGRFGLWKYTDPLSPGRYVFRAVHRPLADAPDVESGDVPFEIAAATVSSLALSYDTSQRDATIMVWLAAPAKDDGGERLLLRWSAGAGHNAAEEGATPYASPVPSVRVALGQIPPAGDVDIMGWLAVAWENRVQLLRHEMARPLWQSQPIALPVKDVQPLQRFPDRERAVFLATGKGTAGPALCGVVVQEETEEEPQPWSVPLSVSPAHAVCSFGTEGPISLLFVVHGEKEDRLVRMAVDESGTVTAPETVVRATPNRVLAVATDMREEAPPTFLVLEADRHKHNCLALVRIPLEGELTAREPVPLAGWPGLGEEGDGQPLPVAEIALETSPKGVVWIALTDQAGALYGARLDGKPLKLYRDAQDGRRATHPHVGALRNVTTLSCFSETGGLFHVDVSGDF